PKNAISDPAKLKDKQLRQFVEADTPITEDHLVGKNDKGLELELKPGQRATAIRVNQEQVIGGFILPGTHVDVICTFRDDRSTKLILQNMLVLAADNVDKDAKDPTVKTILAQTVTLAATPEEAAHLALSGSMGELRLWLRHPGDEERLTGLTI